MVPRLLWKQVRTGKPFNICKRLFPESRPALTCPIIWVHAVSVGEVHAISSVVKAIKKRRPSFHIIVSTITQTGQETAKKVISEADAFLFLPFDFRCSIRRALRSGIPSLVLFSEGDLWPVFMDEMKRHNAQIAVVNGKISETTFGWFKRFPNIGRWLYAPVDLFCLQNQLFADRFLEIGIPPSALSVTGSTKADVSFPILSADEKSTFRSSLGISETDSLIVLGSTHDPEEEQLVGRLALMVRDNASVRLTIVPRHPERFQTVFDRIKQMEPSTVLLSTYDGHSPWKIMIVDRLGMLTKLYQLASVAIVCGSFIERIGGHNILEPACVGVSVIVGPYMHSQPMLYESAKNADALIQVTYDGVADAVTQLLSDEGVRRESSARALLWAETLRGATDRTVELLEQRVLSKIPVLH